MKVSTPSAVRRPIEVMGVFNENAGRMAISAITLSELCHGAEKSAKVAQNLAVVEEFASRLEVLPCMAKASQHYGAIRATLYQVGDRSASMICTSPPMRAAKG